MRTNRIDDARERPGRREGPRERRRPAGTFAERVPLVAACILLAAALHPAFADTFIELTPGTLYDITVPDLTGDGHPDLIVLNRDASQATVFVNDGKGFFLENLPIELSLSPRRAFVGRFTAADDFLDIVFAGNSVRRFVVAPGDGEGLFPGPFEFAVDGAREGGTSLLTDVDGDGELDFVSTEGATISAAFPLSLGSVSGTIDSPLDSTLVLGSGKLRDGGGPQVIAWGRGPEAVLAIYEQGIDGSLRLEATVPRLPFPGGSPQTIAVADLDADGLDEAILLSNAEYQGQRFGLLYLLDWAEASPRARRLGAPVPIHEWHRVSTPVVLEDMNLDGRPDVLVLGRDPASAGDAIWVFLSSEAPADSRLELAGACLVPATGATSFAAADVDRDDVVDLLIGLPERGGVAVLSSPLATCVLSEACFSRRPSVVDDPRGIDVSVVLDRAGGPHLVVAGGGLARLYTRAADGLEESASFETSGTTTGVDAADIDGDGDLEIVLADGAGGHVDVFGSTGGGWQRRRRIAVPGAPEGILLRDLDGNARPDLVATLPGSSGLAVHLQREDRSFGEPRMLRASPEPVQVVAADVAGDAALDLVVRLRGSSELALLVGRGDGEFADAITLRAIGTPSDIHAADLDGDGRAELLATARVSDALTLFRSVGGNFVPSFLALPIGTAPDAVGAADTDGDGRLEVIIGGGAAKTVTIVQVGDAGELSVRATLPLGLRPVPDTPVHMEVADFDRNGWPDFVLADAESGELTYFESSGCGREAFFRRGDVTRDEVVNVSDGIVTLEYLFVGGRTVACPDAADADDDGRIALSDAILVLNYLFGSGEPPASPGPDRCGPDVFPDELGACVGPCR